jgi:predicted secreted protein
MSDNDAEAREAGYVEGKRRAYIDLMHLAAKGLGYDYPLAEAASIITEREEAIAKLRDVCGEHGDNDWSEDLHLADIIEKHLARHLDRKRGGR